MKSYEMYERIKENKKTDFQIAGNRVTVEMMQDQFEMEILNGAILLLFTSMDCVDSEHIEFYLDGVCVANINTSEVA